ncbi:hypothetical protein R1flu_012477 [Riccia fluitans]|uniref:non-specific serine/threonine protein kinase n=1 Tax=Riccia fluitans TaxID=41844 RepID=A0ABD1ZAW6_9MARC
MFLSIQETPDGRHSSERVNRTRLELLTDVMRSLNDNFGPRGQCGEAAGHLGFWERHQKSPPSSKLSSSSEAPPGGTNKDALLGISTLEETGKVTRRGGRPASKSPLMTEAGGSTNGNVYSLASAKVDSQREDSSVSRPVKETHHALRYEDPDGNKMINEYVRDCKIGTGSYGKVVLHRSRKDDKLYAIKIFHKSRLRKLRVAPAETALMDVLREVSIMKKLDHPNIVKLVEVIDDPESDYFYMVLEYVEGRWIFEGSGPPGGIGEETARRYFRDVVAGLGYLHKNHIVHGDIKPENLLISRGGRIKIGDFGVSRTFEGENDELRRSPGTPVYTAPECCLGVTYRGRAADVWALGCTLYCMVLGKYPFVGDTLQGTYERIVNEEFWYPEDIDPDLLNLLRGLLCKDPKKRLTLDEVANHPWLLRDSPSS